MFCFKHTKVSGIPRLNYFYNIYFSHCTWWPPWSGPYFGARACVQTAVLVHTNHRFVNYRFSSLCITNKYRVKQIISESIGFNNHLHSKKWWVV